MLWIDVARTFSEIADDCCIFYSVDVCRDRQGPQDAAAHPLQREQGLDRYCKVCQRHGLSSLSNIPLTAQKKQRTLCRRAFHDSMMVLKIWKGTSSH